MKKTIWCMVLVALGLVGFKPLHATPPEASKLVVSDFDTGAKPNSVGGDFGTWDKDPEDETQGCRMAFASDDAIGDGRGYSIRLDYDVDSLNPAYNGFWMKLEGLDARKYDMVSFWLKGDEEIGYPRRLKIELKDQSNKPSAFVINGIAGEWQKFTIPFEKFRRITDWSALSEFVIVFEDLNSRPKTGTVYLDHVSFVKEA